MKPIKILFLLLAANTNAQAAECPEYPSDYQSMKSSKSLVLECLGEPVAKDKRDDGKSSLVFSFGDQPDVYVTFAFDKNDLVYNAQAFKRKSSLNGEGILPGTLSESSKAIIEIYLNKLEFTLPKNWKQAFRKNGAVNFITEFIRAEESVDNWSEMLTLQGVKAPVTSERLDGFIEMTSQGIEKTCPNNFVYEIYSNREYFGRETRTRVMGCSKVEQSNEKIKLAKGQSELGYFFYFFDDAHLYQVSFSKRGGSFDKADYKSALKDLERAFMQVAPIRVCEKDGKPNKPCPKKSYTMYFGNVM